MTNSRANQGPPTTQEVKVTTSLTSTSSTFEDASGLTLTLPNNNGKSLIHLQVNWTHSGTVKTAGFRFVDNTTNIAGITDQHHVANHWQVTYLTYIAENDGQAVKVQFKTSGATLTVYGSTANADTVTRITSFELP